MKSRCLISCDGFNLTDSIRNQVESTMDQIDKYLKREATVRFHLAGALNSGFDVKLKMHLGKRDYTAEAHEKGLYLAIAHAKRNLIRQMSDKKSKKIKSRHQNKLAI